MRLPARIHTIMKNDISFKLVTAIVFAGVLVAFFGPSHAVQPPEGTTDQHAASLVQQAE